MTSKSEEPVRGCDINALALLTVFVVFGCTIVLMIMIHGTFESARRIESMKPCAMSGESK